MLTRLRRLLRPFGPTSAGVPAPVARPPVAATAAEVLGRGSARVIDAGGRWGADHAWFRLRPLAQVIGFEPDAEECARLNACSTPGQERFVPVALGRREGTATLYMTTNPACASLYPPSAEVCDRYPESLGREMRVAQTLPVQLTTLERWAAGDGVNQVDFIKLDTQGSDLDILHGAGRLLDGCLGVEAEVMFSPLYDGQPLFADVDQFLRQRGFTLWRITSLAHYVERLPARLSRSAHVHYGETAVSHPTGSGRLMWGEAIYFRDWRGFTGDLRALLVLASLFDALGDADAAAASLRSAADLARRQGHPAAAVLGDVLTGYAAAA